MEKDRLESSNSRAANVEVEVAKVKL